MKKFSIAIVIAAILTLVASSNLKAQYYVGSSVISTDYWGYTNSSHYSTNLNTSIWSF